MWGACASACTPDIKCGDHVGDMVGSMLGVMLGVMWGAPNRGINMKKIKINTPTQK